MYPDSFFKSTIATNIVTTNTEPKLSAHMHRMYLQYFENNKCKFLENESPAVAVKRGYLGNVQ